MRTIFKKLLFYTYRPLLQVYLKRERKYYIDNFRMVILPGVFHPGLFYSTLFLYEELKKIDLNGKHVIEMGAGTGFLSVYCTRNGATTTAADISWKAIINIDKNARWNRVAMSIIQSDLFNNIPKQTFDYIIVNPPYYKKDPKTEADHAWYCGKEMEYFSRLFPQMAEYMNKSSKTLMVLSQDCDISRVKQLALENNFNFDVFAVKKFFLEKNYIFKVTLK